MAQEPRSDLDRDRRIGGTFSFYLHFDERDALDAAAAELKVSPNAVLRDLIRDSFLL